MPSRVHAAAASTGSRCASRQPAPFASNAHKNGPLKNPLHAPGRSGIFIVAVGGTLHRGVVAQTTHCGHIPPTKTMMRLSGAGARGGFPSTEHPRMQGL